MVGRLGVNRLSESAKFHAVHSRLGCLSLLASLLVDLRRENGCEVLAFVGMNLRTATQKKGQFVV